MVKIMILGISLFSTLAFAGTPRPGAPVTRAYHCGSLTNSGGIVMKGVAYALECQFRLKNVVSCETYKQSIRPGNSGSPTKVLQLTVLNQDKEVAVVVNNESEISATIYKKQNAVELVLERTGFVSECVALND